MSVFTSDDINVIRRQIQKMRDTDSDFQRSVDMYIAELDAIADDKDKEDD